MKEIPMFLGTDLGAVIKSSEGVVVPKNIQGSHNQKLSFNFQACVVITMLGLIDPSLHQKHIYKIIDLM